MIFATVALFLAYTIFIWIKEGVLSSISASSYIYPFLFRLWLVLMALSCYHIEPSVWTAYMGIGLAITGMTPDHKKNPNHTEDEFHTYGTIFAILSGFAGLYFLYGMWIPHVVMAVGTGLLYWKANNWIWYAEILSVAVLGIGYYLGG